MPHTFSNELGLGVTPLSSFQHGNDGSQRHLGVSVIRQSLGKVEEA